MHKSKDLDKVRKLYAEKVKQLYRHIPIGVAATLVNSLILIFILWQVISILTLIIWFAACVSVSFFRALLFFRFSHSPQTPTESRGHEMWFNLSIASSGIVWGSAGIFLFPMDSIIHQMFLAFVLGGMVAGATGTFSIIIRSFIAYALPALGPIIIRFFLIGDHIHFTMGGMTLLFGLLMFLTAKRLNAATLSSLQLGFENDDRKRMEEALRNAREELEIRVRERTSELEKRAEQLARLSLELSLAEQRERSRIAKILHDHLQQLLVGARINQEVLIGSIDFKNKPMAERVLALISQSIKEMRSLNAELAPPVLNSGDLSSSLDWLARWMHENQSFEVKVESETPIFIDRKDFAVLLFQSIRELLLNVLKHSGEQSASVKMDYQNGNLRVVISDQGVGFNADGIWEQAASDKKFGLISIRERLLHLGGRLDIESAPDSGTTISLIVPLNEKRSVESGVAALSAEPPGKPVSEPEAIRISERKIGILLVDDHPVMREGLSKLLESHSDIEIVGEASDGEEAVRLARNIVPDVILMDINMPNMNGLEATRIIHSELPHIRILGLSMYDEDDQSAAMMLAGASAYRSKNENTDRLLAAIRGDIE